MKVTKLEHSGIVVEKDGKKIVFDPVEFAKKLPELENVEAIVITHVHSDHCQPDNIKAILEKNPDAKVYAPEDATAQLPEAMVVKAGDNVEVGGFKLEFYGRDHAAIFPGKVPCQNIGTVVDGKMVNPGDSFDMPENMAEIELLLVPEVAPWMKASEAVEYIQRVEPKMVIPVHDGLLSEMGKNIYDNFLRAACGEVGAEYATEAEV